MPDPKDKKKGIGPTDIMLKSLAETPGAMDYSKNITDDISPYSSFTNMNIPTVGSPWQFQKDPMIRGMGVAKTYQDIIKARPGLGSGNVKEIDSGPTRSMQLYLKNQPNRKVNEYTGYPEDNNLSGMYYGRDRNISLNPTKSGNAVYDTLAHELLHSRGAEDYDVTDPFSTKFSQINDSSYGKDINLPVEHGLGYSVKKITELMKKK